MPSLLDALKNAKLVDPEKVKRVEEEKTRQLKIETGFNESIAYARSFDDAAEKAKEERFLKRASRETTKAGSRVGTKQYFDRFK